MWKTSDPPLTYRRRFDPDLDLDPDLDPDPDLDLSRPPARREPGTAAARNGAWPRGVEEAGRRSSF
jgi:hypothetical protein